MCFSIVMLVYRRVYKVVKQIRFLFQFFFHQTTMYRGFITSSLFCSLQFANHFNHLLTSFFRTIHKSISRSIRNTFIKVAPQIHTRPNVVIRCPPEKNVQFLVSPRPCTSEFTHLVGSAAGAATDDRRRGVVPGQGGTERGRRLQHGLELRAGRDGPETPSRGRLGTSADASFGWKMSIVP